MIHADEDVKLFTTFFFAKFKDALNSIKENEEKEFENQTILEIQNCIEDTYQALIDAESEIENLAEFFEERINKIVQMQIKVLDFNFLIEVKCKDVMRFKNDN